MLYLQKNNESRLSDLSPDPGLPLYDPSRIGQQVKIDRPRGTVATQRFQSNVEGKDEFKKKSVATTVRIINSLKGKPNSINEIQFKIRQDIDSKVLIS